VTLTVNTDNIIDSLNLLSLVFFLQLISGLFPPTGIWGIISLLVFMTSILACSIKYLRSEIFDLTIPFDAFFIIIWIVK